MLAVALSIVLFCRGTKIIRVSPASLSTAHQTTANFFSAGLLNQPEEAFQFMLDHPSFKGEEIFLVPNSNLGVDYKSTCNKIEQVIVEHDFKKVRFFGISLGTKVGHYFAVKQAYQMTNVVADGENDLRYIEIECYDINPCWTPEFLKPKLGMALQLIIPIINVIGIVLIFVMPIPIIRSSGLWFSPMLFTSQLELITYHSERGDYFETQLSRLSKKLRYHELNAVTAIIINDQDEFLNNQKIIEYYRRNKSVIIFEVETRHGDTIGSGTVYREAIDAILANR